MLGSFIRSHASDDAAIHSLGVSGLAKSGRRSVRLVLALIACVAIVFFGLGQFAGAFPKELQVPVAHTVVAERFDLIGANGKPAASLHTGGDGTPVVRFFDEKGLRMLDAGMLPRGASGIFMLDANGQWKLRLSVETKIQTPHIILANGGVVRGSVHLSIGEQDYAGVSILKPVNGAISLGMSDDGPVGMFFQKDDEVRMILSSDFGLSLLEGQGGITRASARLLDDGSLRIMLRNRQRRPTFSIIVDNSGMPSFQFFDMPKPR